ncbi:hypothetical protein DFJ73DRAFT_69804 [Zopfochytrium polystomum]|nr:hypothetical protein DFJ73DRAFT_69804 [Zopfochytrium polystomum]
MLGIKAHVLAKIAALTAPATPLGTGAAVERPNVVDSQRSSAHEGSTPHDDAAGAWQETVAARLSGRFRFVQEGKLSVTLSSIFRSPIAPSPSLESWNQAAAVDGVTIEGVSNASGGVKLAAGSRSSLFEAVKGIAARWGHDQFISAAESDGCHLLLTVKPSVLFNSVIQKIIEEKDHFGFSDIFKEELPLSAVVECELPGFGQSLNPHHLRGVLTANYVHNCLHLSGVIVQARCKLRVWSIESGIIIHQFMLRGDEESLQKSPLDYMHKLLQNAHGEADGTTLRLNALSCLRDLAQGETKTMQAFSALYSAWLKTISHVLDRFGGGDGIRLELVSDELQIGQGPELRSLLDFVAGNGGDWLRGDSSVNIRPSVIR